MTNPANIARAQGGELPTYGSDAPSADTGRVGGVRRILAIDPGTLESGWVVMDSRRVVESGIDRNEDVLARVDCWGGPLAIEGVLAALMIPITLVTPQSWKKRAGLIGADKDAARSRAIQLWPRWDALGKKAAGQAFADAAMIARFGDPS